MISSLKIFRGTVLSLTLAAAAQAGILSYNTQGAFVGQGVVAFESTFNDFGTAFGFPSNPFTRGDVTYQSSENLTWGSSTGYTTTETLIGNNYWTPILGSINSAPNYTMFGFNVGSYGGSPLTFSIFTNAATYSFPSLTVADSAAGNLDFLGFVATGGEYFTGFRIDADDGPGNLPGITHVSVGHAGNQPVPDGAPTLVLLGMAFTVCRALRREHSQR